MQQADLNPNEAPRYRCMMGSRCATIPQLTHPLWYGGTFSIRLPPQQQKEGGDPQGDARADKRSRNSGKTKAEPRCHTTATPPRLPECNSSAGEGRRGHIYSVCHRETYFSPLGWLVQTRHISALVCSVIRSRHSEPRRPQLGFFFKVQAHLLTNNGDLGELGLVRFISGHMASDGLGQFWWG